MVSPVIADPPPIVEEAWEIKPFDVVKKVVDAYGSVLERVVEVAVKLGAVTVPVKTPAPETERSVPGLVVPMPTFPWLVTVKKVLVPKLLVVEPIVKRFKATEVEAAKTERRAEGVVVPKPR